MASSWSFPLNPIDRWNPYEFVPSDSQVCQGIQCGIPALGTMMWYKSDLLGNNT